MAYANTTTSGYYYDVKDYKGFGGLYIRDHNKFDFDKVVEEIRDICKRAADRGYKNDDKYIIVLVEWERTFDEDGAFYSAWSKEKAVALYDNGEVFEY